MDSFDISSDEIISLFLNEPSLEFDISDNEKIKHILNRLIFPNFDKNKKKKSIEKYLRKKKTRWSKVCVYKCRSVKAISRPRAKGRFV